MGLQILLRGKWRETRSTALKCAGMVSHLGHPGAVPPKAQINDAVQVVSSNRGSSATAALRDVQVDLVDTRR